MDYASAGVDLEAGQAVLRGISAAVKSTYTPAVQAGLGSFGGVFSASALAGMADPLLVATTDGVGTKVILAAQLCQYRNLGLDIVNHCANDLLVQGARPLFLLDYVAADRLSPDVIVELVEGMADGCRQLGCALLGGETAEMPGVYATDRFDLAATMVGCVDRPALLPRGDLRPGDVVVGLRSSGPHTNGYSLIRRVFSPEQLAGDAELAAALLAPHRAYGPLLTPHLGKVKALAHITGGGFEENLPRVLPDGVQARLRWGSWALPPVFQRIQREGGIADGEMRRVFNLGLGMLVVLAASEVHAFRAALGEESWVIGELAPGQRGVEWV
jgi:phosphoribosylformylglycinamidine cyclo-ligase